MDRAGHNSAAIGFVTGPGIAQALDQGEITDVPQLKNRASTDGKYIHARAEDFEQLFANETTDLLRLSLQLTADAEKAESCLIFAMRDCLFRSSIAKHHAHAWAHRMVIRNAIRLLWGIPNDLLCESGFEFPLQPSEFSFEGLRDSVAILTLPDLDRLAFVICGLERHSILDCALLLRRAPQEVYDAIMRAAKQVLSPEQCREHEANPTYLAGSGRGLWGQWKNLESSCGSILD
jgi:DNA-directed RNA polymerase specialized sigma24 family protein